MYHSQTKIGEKQNCKNPGSEPSEIIKQLQSSLLTCKQRVSIFATPRGAIVAFPMAHYVRVEA